MTKKLSMNKGTEGTLLCAAGGMCWGLSGSIENLLLSMPAIIAGVASAVCVMIYNCSDRLISRRDEPGE